MPKDEEKTMGLICPITQEPIKEPIVAADGHTYEKEAMQRWIQTKLQAKQPVTSPMTGIPLTHLNLVPNYAMKQLDSVADSELSSEGGARINLLSLEVQMLKEQLAAMAEALSALGIAAKVERSSAGNLAQVETLFFTRDKMVKSKLVPEQQSKLVQACLHGKLEEVEKLIAEGAEPRLADEDNIYPLGASYLGMNEQLIAYLMEKIEPDPQYIQTCLIANKQKYGCALSEWKDPKLVNLTDMAGSYINEGLRRVIFSDWARGSGYTSWSNIEINGTKATAITRQAKDWIFGPDDSTLLWELTNLTWPRGVVWAGFLKQYNKCYDANLRIKASLKPYLDALESLAEVSATAEELSSGSKSNLQL